MARKLEVDIKETTKELKQLLHQQKRVRIRERVQVLYWLKSKPTPNALIKRCGADWSNLFNG